jgi:hypothetical protein
MFEALPNATFTYGAHLFMGLLTLIAFFKLKQSYREQGTETLDYFAKFFGMFSMFMLIQGMPMLVPESLNPAQLGSFFIFGHIFLYASFAYLVMVPLHIYKPSLKKYGFWGSILGGAIITFVNTIYWTMPEISGNIVLWHVGFPVGPMIGILDIITMVLIAAVFFARLAWKNSGSTRTKFALLALGLVVITAGGPLHDNATSLQMYIIADILTLVGLLILFSGIYADKLHELLGWS